MSKQKTFRLVYTFSMAFTSTHYPEIEVTEIILTKVSGLCQLSSTVMNQKSQDVCQMFVITKKETLPKGLDLSIESTAYN
jgi:hypothetical protein